MSLLKNKIQTITRCISHATADGLARLMHEPVGGYCETTGRSEIRIQNKIGGIFLLSTPFWSGEEEWKQGLKLQQDFASKLPKNVPIFLYHSKDDEEVPFDHLELYAQYLPKATVRKITGGGHQLNNDLSPVAKDIKSV